MRKPILHNTISKVLIVSFLIVLMTALNISISVANQSDSKGIVSTDFLTSSAINKQNDNMIISAGGAYVTMVIKQDGCLWAWGDNGHGQVGVDVRARQMTPVKVLSDVVFAHVGHMHSVAIKKDGSLWAWGSNSSGQIGDGTRTDKYIPTKIMDGVASVSTGYGATMAIKQDGSLWAWGDMDSICSSTVPVKLFDDVVATSQPFGNSTLVIKKDGSLWAWVDPSFVYGPVSVGQECVSQKILDNVKAVELGNGCVFAIKQDDSLWAWGPNANGQVGNGMTSWVLTPVKIMDNVESVRVGSGYTMAIKKDGSLWAWGNNSGGFLGDGTTSSKTSPVKIMENVLSIDVMPGHTMAIKKDGSLWSWGKNNRNGVLGNGTVNDSIIPVKILDGVISVSAASNHTAAVTNDGSVLVWGGVSGGTEGSSSPQYVTSIYHTDGAGGDAREDNNGAPSLYSLNIAHVGIADSPGKLLPLDNVYLFRARVFIPRNVGAVPINEPLLITLDIPKDFELVSLGVFDNVNQIKDSSKNIAGYELTQGLQNNEEIILTWTLRSTRTVFYSTDTAVFNVTASVEGSNIAYEEIPLIYKSTATWNFENRKELIRIDDDPLFNIYHSLNQLLAFTPTENHNISQKHLNSNEKEGRCHGMVTTVAFFNEGRLTPAHWQQNVKSVSEISYEESFALINYYHVLQELSYYQQDVAYCLSNTTKANIIDMENYMNKNENVLFAFQWYNTSKKETEAHIVLLYGDIQTYDEVAPNVEMGLDSWYGSVGKYKYRIVMYDSAFPNDFMYIYYTANKEEFIIPYLSSTTKTNLQIKSVLSSNTYVTNTNRYNPEAKGFVPYPVSASVPESAPTNYVLRSYASDKFTVSSSSGEIVTINGSYTDGTLEAYPFVNSNAVVGDEDVKAENEKTLYVFLPKANETYAVKNTNGYANIDMSMTYDNHLLHGQCADGNNITFAPNGVVSINMNNSDYTIIQVYNEGHFNIPWHTITVSGENANTASLERISDDTLFTCDNMKNVIVTGNSDSGAVILSFSTDNKSVLLKAEDNVMVAYVDTNDNGIFDVPIAISKPFIANPFTDIKESDWFYNDVLNAYHMGLINGKTPTTYAPNDNLTYAEAVKLAACMHELYTTGKITLGNGSPVWYQSYVDYAKANKIISKDYEWSAQATRAGYMEIFANALPDEALAAINTIPDGSIPDVSAAHPQAEAIYKLYRAGILQGVDAAHNCNPSSNIRRSEVAAILTRMMDGNARLKFSF